ncbi:MAG: type II toxin-antitoxin system HicB family antitoxin [Armatimonadetes bacterium]|nr:type II toxin-antitoxin system HicB family antitoxin [Armatimonadota bacterium]
MKFTAIVQPDSAPSGVQGYSAHCPELDVASQGDTPDEARANLREALELFLEDADPDEVSRRLEQGAQVSAFKLAAQSKMLKSKDNLP